MGFILSPRVEVLHWYNEKMLVFKDAKEYKLNSPQAQTLLKAINGIQLSANELNFVYKIFSIFVLNLNISYLFLEFDYLPEN